MDLMVIVRAVHLGATVLTAGAFAFRFFVLPRAQGGEGRNAVHSATSGWLVRTAGWGLAILLATWLLWLALTAASMSGESLARSLSIDLLRTVLAETTFGHVWLLRFTLAVLLGLHLLWMRRKTAAASVLGPSAALVSALLLVSLAWTGHAVGTAMPLRAVHLTADTLHLLGAGLWLGALAPLFFLLDRARTQPGNDWQAFAATATRRFSSLGIVAMATLLVTGAINAWFLVGGVDALMGTGYGRLVLAKLGLFVAIVLIAAVNRFWLTPRLQRSDSAVQRTALPALRRNVMLEMALGATALGVAALLGTTAPSSHQHGPAMRGMPGPAAPADHGMQEAGSL
jgi:putative copper resistance protein D